MNEEGSMLKVVARIAQATAALTSQKTISAKTASSL